MMNSEVFNTLTAKHQSLWTTFSMSEDGLKFLLSEISKGRRKNIIEFGSGLSTVYMAELAKLLLLDVKIISVESDHYWLDKVEKHAAIHDLLDYVDFIYAPVYPDLRLGGKNKWYDISVLNKSVSSLILFDLVLIDGPIAYYPDISLSRYGALPFVISRSTVDCLILLDDCNRSGEKAVLDRWKEEFNTYNDNVGDLAVVRLKQGVS